MNLGSEWSYLIVNADDYGYFSCVSRGILESARNGIVTATGIFANSIHFDEHVDRLLEEESLDLGVHLNLTGQAPLTVNMQEKLSRWSGLFPHKYAIAKAVLSGAITADDVKLEWSTQIERCLDKGLEIRFLNSHEHIHMLPSLFPVVQALAEKYRIQHIRFPTPELFQSLGIGALIRDTSMKILGVLNHRRLKKPTTRFLGMGESGRLSLPYLKQRLTKLIPGQVYELMCHPGHYDANEINDTQLLNYHDWEGEFDALTNTLLQDILHENKIRLIGYRHLQIKDSQLSVEDTIES